MKLVAFCLFALCCWSLDNMSANANNQYLQRRKLQEVLRRLNTVKASLQDSKQSVNTPPQDIEDCCCLSALQCFRENLHVEFNVSTTNHFYRSLKHNLTEGGLDFCNSRNVNSTCQACQSHPKENAKEFFNRLQSLIQKGKKNISSLCGLTRVS
uniref:Interleukin n=1 Tax=Mola mola TaxID=94237 RepID=A0A3Q3VTI4_MOLML